MNLTSIAMYLASLAISVLVIWPATLLLTRQVRHQARRLGEQVDDQIKANEHIIRLLEDLIRIEPERAETLEMARLDLIRGKERQGHSAAALHATGDLHRPWSALPRAVRAWRARRRSNREGGAA